MIPRRLLVRNPLALTCPPVASCQPVPSCLHNTGIILPQQLHSEDTESSMVQLQAYTISNSKHASTSRKPAIATLQRTAGKPTAGEFGEKSSAARWENDSTALGGSFVQHRNQQLVNRISRQKPEQENRQNTSCVGMTGKTTQTKYFLITSQPEETGSSRLQGTGKPQLGIKPERGLNWMYKNTYAVQINT
ncbi:hypothetical protein Baya_11351 [Bagarius yarrelli]|uniref:Uncharacterized protein n=1 Tax=Bagarius yarrelli TaxID=175774 RepID=A0A556UZY9_BAGYA|nr:hypothetical protein Baya_11351 [Bagarius yarrelli]